jgi:hypothetical protein
MYFGFQELLWRVISSEIHYKTTEHSGLCDSLVFRPGANRGVPIQIVYFWKFECVYSASSIYKRFVWAV